MRTKKEASGQFTSEVSFPGGTKVNIALCDDDHTQLEYLQGLVRQWAQMQGTEVTLSCFPSAEAFLFSYADEHFDALLLDIQMEGESGMELARRLRSTDGKLVIVFITGYPDYMAEGYEVDALHYLMKPVEPEKFFGCLDRAAARTDRAGDTLVLQESGDLVRIPFRDIIYAQSGPHISEVHTLSGIVTTRLPLAELAHMLGSGQFVRCHRCVVAGIRHIRRITRTEIQLESGEMLPLSRRLYDEVNRTFIRFYRRDAK